MEVQRSAYSVLEFCTAHRISRAKLYQLWQEGQGPDRIRVGSRVLISVEAATRWRMEMEEAAR